ncbi:MULTISPECIES: energy-coupling factor ABC transporter ATP-binding protein [unclassified Granulicatella]|uniref:energy-coupling factor ABC transporter ATP-binding protein n=1 Tax=unclassified Granulicatella TaxID=2630493 RepID=UPI001073FA90|nr:MULTISPECIES: ATP-binding cassette domain-containing protein [unclassified Granulicatella]MBF0779526.1 ATP-binding cassette domain-containing protein [Granulicatella sp. 19428wC4_WM01]TFU96491.1 ATP-binding cassette domain-containing protein [Granulicatella sp. WM01]
MLKIENMTYAYDVSFGNVIKHITMDFDCGKIIGILGINGSGKSTIMKGIMGLHPLNEGHVIYNYNKLSLKKQELYRYRQDVCIVFQDSDQQLFYALVEDDVALALKNLHYDEATIKQRVHDALEAMHISHLGKQPIHYLSFGQKKRVAIAGVLALKPKYLLLDEPTAGLDPRGRVQMLQLMKELAQNGTTIILTSHDMDLMYDCCDYAYVVDKGEIVLEGNKQDIFLEKDVLEKIGLSLPWIVKLHLALGTPLCENEIEFFRTIGSEKTWQNQ